MGKLADLAKNIVARLDDNKLALSRIESNVDLIMNEQQSIGQRLTALEARVDKLQLVSNSDHRTPSSDFRSLGGSK